MNPCTSYSFKLKSEGSHYITLVLLKTRQVVWKVVQFFYKRVNLSIFRVTCFLAKLAKLSIINLHKNEDLNKVWQTCLSCLDKWFFHNCHEEIFSLSYWNSFYQAKRSKNHPKRQLLTMLDVYIHFNPNGPDLYF